MASCYNDGMDYLTIQQMAGRTGLSEHTLRYYERIGLLAGVRRDEKGYRLYAEADLEWIRFLIRLRETGMPIRDAKRFSALREQGEKTFGERLEMLTEHRELIEAELRKWQEHRRKVDEKIEYYRSRLDSGSPSERSGTLVVLLHEIYGLNDHIRYYEERLRSEGTEVFAPDLLNREAFAYEEEEEAYRFFTEEVGFDRALGIAREAIRLHRTRYERVFVVGFSVGATVAWRCADDAGVDGVVCYYGSRIRDYADVSPRCPALLLFSEDEEKRMTPETQRVLEVKSRTHVEYFRGAHGFANPYDKQYDPLLTERAYRKLAAMLRGDGLVR